MGTKKLIVKKKILRNTEKLWLFSPVINNTFLLYYL